MNAEILTEVCRIDIKDDAALWAFAVRHSDNPMHAELMYKANQFSERDTDLIRRGCEISARAVHSLATIHNLDQQTALDMIAFWSDLDDRFLLLPGITYPVRNDGEPSDITLISFSTIGVFYAATIRLLWTALVDLVRAEQKAAIEQIPNENRPAAICPSCHLPFVRTRVSHEFCSQRCGSLKRMRIRRETKKPRMFVD